MNFACKRKKRNQTNFACKRKKRNENTSRKLQLVDCKSAIGESIRSTSNLTLLNGDCHIKMLPESAIHKI